jgi:hypothetical protein
VEKQAVQRPSQSMNNQCKIKRMKSWRVFLVVAILVMGVGSGLIYGWLVDPVVYVDTSPDTLRIDYQTDIILMVSDIYSDDLDLQGAYQRLSLLNSTDVNQVIDNCLDYAQRMNFSAQDITNIMDLRDAIEMGEPKGTEQP